MRKVSRVSRPALKRISSGGVVLALVALFGLPTAAFAVNDTSASLSGNTVTVNTTGSVVNRINISDSSENVEISDTRQTEVAGTGCTLVGGDEIHCPIDGVTTVVVNLGGGDDTLSVFGSSLIYQVNAGAGDDVVSTGGGNDLLNGEDGDDLLRGRLGADAVNGGEGAEDEDGDTVDDYASRLNVNHTVTLDGVANDGTTDTDTVAPGNQSEGDNIAVDIEVVRTGSGNDNLTAGTDVTQSVTLEGGDDIDVLTGGAGTTTLQGDDGGDSLNGGSGFDTVNYNRETSSDVTVTVNDGLANDGPAGEGDNVGALIDKVVGGIGDDLLIGSAAAETLDGAGGGDTLDGGLGADVLNGATGTDTAWFNRATAVTVTLNGVADDTDGDNVGGTGNTIENVTGGDGGDTITGNTLRNRLEGGAGADTLNGGDNNDTFVGGTGGDTFNGGAGTGDLVTYAAATAGVTVTIGDGAANDGQAGEGDEVLGSVERVTGSDHVDSLTGSGSHNTLSGGQSADTLLGLPGNDVLNGGDGGDTLNGGDGGDTLNGGNGGDALIGGLGSDLVSYSTRPAGVDVTQDGVANDGEAGENDDVHGSVERVLGTNFADLLEGDAGKDVLNGRGGGDTVRGLGGADTLTGSTGNDTIVGGSGSDVLTGNEGDDTLNSAGDGARDSLNCGTGNDNINRDPIDRASANCFP